jgi:hypothetical protein
LHLSVDDAKAQKRVEARDGASVDLERARAHRVESELAASLPSVADRLIDANPPVAVIVDQVLTALAKLGVPAETVEHARGRLR